jgi:hypothetical protein
MHMDALLSRRLHSGAPVVHGIHLLLWALDSMAKTEPELPPLQNVRAEFHKYVYLDEAAEVLLAKRGPSKAQLSVSVGGASGTKIVIGFGDPPEHCSPWADSSLSTVSVSPEPLAPGFEQMAGCRGRLPFQMTEADAAEMFPAAANWLGFERIAALAASSQLVGMVCPGLHSIYNGLSVSASAESALAHALAFHVAETDARFRSVELQIAGGGLVGSVSCFARTPPVEQASMKSLAGLVSPTEFAGSVALIVGGSRGLGELTAKIIASGGGRVVVTWHRGKEDAERVVKEIRAAGGACQTLEYDAGRPAAEQLARLTDAPTHAYFFATPVIFRAQAEIFSTDRLEEFLKVYVDGFWNLAKELRARRPGVSVFYPSSVSVSERPRGMTEYSMAKAAGEVLCADMNQSLAPMRVTVSRLPRLPTDQTTSIVPVDTASALETMLPIIREVQTERS